MNNIITKEVIDGKRVLLRSDLNVPIKDGVILDDTRIRKSIKTIKFIIENNASVIVMSHLGKVKTEEDMLKNTLAPVAKRLEELIKKEVTFINKPHGKLLEDTCKNLNPGQIIMMENTRYEDVPYKLESNCDKKLSEYWASLGDVFVNDAFGSSHRVHASVCGIRKFLPSYNGFLLEEEINTLDKIIKHNESPFLVIMGGAKVDDKIDLIKTLISKCDNLMVGGGIANTFLAALKYEIGSSLYSKDYLEEIKSIYENNSNKIVLPADVIVKRGTENINVDIDKVMSGDTIYDIGYKSINKFRNIIYNANTIFINGTVGLYEQEEYAKGTKELLDACADSEATVIAAGGDSVSAVNHFNHNTDFLVSTGGGAALEYIAYGDLPGIVK